jgi:hypothetical protein
VRTVKPLLAGLVVGVVVGFAANAISGELLAWEGFVFGVLGGVFAYLLYVTDGHPLRSARSLARFLGGR